VGWVRKVFARAARTRHRLEPGSGGRWDRPLLRRIVYLLAFVHLALVAAVIFHRADPWIARGWWERPLGFWGGVNFSMWRFGFFSPDVGKSSEIEFKINYRDGRVEKLSTLSDFDFFTANHESLIRFYGFRIHTAEDPALQDLCARSVVVRLLNELGISEDVVSVDYALRSIRYPTMQGFRAGEPVETTEFYRTNFVMAQE
jgi:hypothetical protein